MPRASIALALTLTLLTLTAPSAAQGRGDYLNFESPQVKPIAAVDVDGWPFLLVCNTPDNTVEVFDVRAIESMPAAGTMADDHGLVARIPVGLEPVSLTYHAFATPNVNMLYTANWLGDSVTYVALAAPEGVFSYQVLRTVDLRGEDTRAQTRPGDEPMDLAVVDQPGEQHLLVTKRLKSSISWLNPFTGNPRRVNGTDGGGADVILTSDGMFEWGGPNDPSGAMAVKQPHTILTTPTGFWVLGNQGGGSALALEQVSSTFDLDLWTVDFSTPTPVVRTVGGLGTTNFNMDLAPDGHLYVVGTQALNNVEGNASLANLKTGFVKTLLHKLDTTVDPPAVKTRDLNLRKGHQNGMGLTPPRAVNPRTQGMGHATDVSVYDGEVVAVVAFNSDRFALVDTAPGNPLNWRLGYANVPAVSGNVDDVAGPRGLAVRRGTAVEGDPGDRIYLMNRLENSITVVDPNPDGNASTLDPVVIDSFMLANDPVPAEVRDGQKFLYSTRFSGKGGIAGGFVSCASCHVDARSDQLVWLLTPEDDIPLPSAPELNGVPASFVCDLMADPELEEEGEEFGFPSEDGKGPKVTQSLQGLLNWDVEGERFDLVSNAPYHWRGDKPAFTDFNEAFVGLQGMPNIGTTLAPRGLEPEDMEAYETFINTIHYPPNPLQRDDRTYRGVSTDPDSPVEGSGALRGQKLFHIVDTPEVLNCPNGSVSVAMAGRSCVQCHSLPEGSNNRIVSRIGGQPIETAALRGLRQKEARLELDSVVPAACSGVADDLRTGDFGLGNEGETGLTINSFHQLLAKNATEEDELAAINEYLLELDTGVAPVVGRTVTVLPGEDRSIELQALEDQAAEANCGIAVYFRDGAVERGFWYRMNQPLQPATYWEAQPGSGSLDRAGLLGLLDPGDLLVFTATPLGSERRVASLLTSAATAPALPSGTLPSVLLWGTTPNTANEPIPSMTVHFEGPIMLSYNGTASCTPPATALSIDTLHILQSNLELLGRVPAGLGHDAPRRLRVRGRNLLQGCKLHLGIDGNPAVPPASASPGDFEEIVLPLYPTTDVVGDDLIWETAVELDPLALYTLLMGGAAAPGVSQAYQGTDPLPGGFQPILWNLFRVQVVNPDGTQSGISLQSLTY